MFETFFKSCLDIFANGILEKVASDYLFFSRSSIIRSENIM